MIKNQNMNNNNLERGSVFNFSNKPSYEIPINEKGLWHGIGRINTSQDFIYFVGNFVDGKYRGIFKEVKTEGNLLIEAFTLKSQGVFLGVKIIFCYE